MSTALWESPDIRLELREGDGWRTWVVNRVAIQNIKRHVTDHSFLPALPPGVKASGFSPRSLRGKRLHPSRAVVARKLYPPFPLFPTKQRHSLSMTCSFHRVHKVRPITTAESAVPRDAPPTPNLSLPRGTLVDLRGPAVSGFRETHDGPLSFTKQRRSLSITCSFSCGPQSWTHEGGWIRCDANAKYSTWHRVGLVGPKGSGLFESHEGGDSVREENRVRVVSPIFVGVVLRQLMEGENINLHPTHCLYSASRFGARLANEECWRRR